MGLNTLLLVAFAVLACAIDTSVTFQNNIFDTQQGPTFLVEPDTKLEFSSNIGGLLNCHVDGNPPPTVEWLEENENSVTESKYIRILKNGSLYFNSFKIEDYRQEIHWKKYKCVAKNSLGKIISRLASVKAVVKQIYKPEVQTTSGFLGSNVLLKCNVPSFVADYVKTVSWLQEPNFNIYPSLKTDASDKYHMLPTGELIIVNVTHSDADKLYKCRTYHKLLNELSISMNSGKIHLTDSRELVPPIMDRKIVKVSAKKGESLLIPCISYANPNPSYQWFVKSDNQEQRIDLGHHSGRFRERQNGLLFITNVEETDANTYYCTAKNSEGSETLEIQLTVISPLSVHIHPQKQTIDLGKSASLKCIIGGSPRTAVWWVKDGQPIRAGARVRFSTNEHIKITSVGKDDRGMYQCFVKNTDEMAQGTAEIKLGEVAPSLVYKFIEQTMQPGPFVSLKCSATGNPPPEISWKLDGFNLPPNDHMMIGQYLIGGYQIISHLNISSVKTEDGGEYTCYAKSKAGEQYHSARLNVYGPIYVRKMPPITAIAGKTLQIKCPVSGYPIEGIVWEKVPPKITPFKFASDLRTNDRCSIICVAVNGDLPLTMVFLKDNKVIQSDDEVYTIKQNDDFTLTLSMSKISERQNGIFECRVENEAGVVSHSSELRVNVPPRISPFNFENNLTEGSRTQIMCSTSQGDLPFQFKWYFNSQLLKEHNELRMNSSLDAYVYSTAVSLRTKSEDRSIMINEYSQYSSILSISDVKFGVHNGNYTCEISNSAGMASFSAVLSVAVPPRWVVEPTDVKVLMGNLVALNCQADGFPTPTIAWKQVIDSQSNEYRDFKFDPDGSNSNTQYFDNGTLILKNVTNEGSFLCQAKNFIGVISKLIKLSVNVRPQVLVENKKVFIRRGNDAFLKCEIYGDQPLDNSWRFRGNTINPMSNIRFSVQNSQLNNGITSTLNIVETTMEDKGEYSCIASNDYGSDHSTIYLQIQEPPSFPRNFHAKEVGSRSVLLAWSSNYDMKDFAETHPIDKFLMQFKDSTQSWSDKNSEQIISGDQNTIMIDYLKPASNYHFRIFAENHLGTSAPSDILHIRTNDEAPSSTPRNVVVKALGAQELLVTWRAPERETWNGDLHGYAIGYCREHSGEKQYNYTKIGTAGDEGLNEFRITNLDKFTAYAVVIKAFNGQGDGPNSAPVITTTLEDVPSAPPQNIVCSTLTSQNIQLTWLPPPKESRHGSVLGYKILYESASLDLVDTDLSTNPMGTRDIKVTSSLNTVLHGLQSYTNYTIQILAYNKAGEGVYSLPIHCLTEEAAPEDAPEKIKAVVKSESSVIISWQPPRIPNGVLIKYTVYLRVLEKGQEIKIVKNVVPSNVNYYEVKELNTRQTYEAWVTSSTKIGNGPSTNVIKLQPSSQVPAAIVSFGRKLSVPWKNDVKLPCVYVGLPRPIWYKGDKLIDNQKRIEISVDNTLIIRNLNRNDEGNYMCVVANKDRIVYQLQVQVPPSPPVLQVKSTTANSVELKWRVTDNGGSQIMGFFLTYREEFGDWEELTIDYRSDQRLLENLLCGTTYQMQLSAFNKIGTGSAGAVQAQTKGSLPIAPLKQHFVRVNMTFVQLELESWQNGGCPITFFSVEHRMDGGEDNDWIIYSSNISPQPRITIGDLQPAKFYRLRVTAHNNAGAKLAEYVFKTFSKTSIDNDANEIQYDQESLEMMGSNVLLVGLCSFFAAILIIIGFYLYLRMRSAGDNLRNGSGLETMKHENIPEYSEDIYPYATFHLASHDNHHPEDRVGDIYDADKRACLYESRYEISQQRKLVRNSDHHSNQKSDSESHHELCGEYFSETVPVHFKQHPSPGPRKLPLKYSIPSDQNHINRKTTNF